MGICLAQGIVCSHVGVLPYLTSYLPISGLSSAKNFQRLGKWAGEKSWRWNLFGCFIWHLFVFDVYLNRQLPITSTAAGEWPPDTAPSALLTFALTRERGTYRRFWMTPPKSTGQTTEWSTGKERADWSFLEGSGPPMCALRCYGGSTSLQWPVLYLLCSGVLRRWHWDLRFIWDIGIYGNCVNYNPTCPCVKLNFPDAGSIKAHRISSSETNPFFFVTLLLQLT